MVFEKLLFSLTEDPDHKLPRFKMIWKTTEMRDKKSVWNRLPVFLVSLAAGAAA